MKQKLVIKVTIRCQKCRSKVLKIAVGFSGVDSVEIDKSQIKVVGDGVDAVKLATCLRKKVGYAEIASLEPVEKEKKEKATLPQQPMSWSYSYGGGVPPFYICEAVTTIIGTPVAPSCNC